MKKVICVIFILLILCSSFVSADEISFSDAKKSFAEKYSENYIEGNNKVRSGIQRWEFIDRYISEAYAGVYDLSEAETILKELKVYKMDTDAYIKGITWAERKEWPVYLITPDIYYDSVNDEWLIISGGYWSEDENFRKDERITFFGDGSQSVGGMEGIGFKMYETAEDEYNAMLNCLVCLSDGEKHNSYKGINNHYPGIGIFMECEDLIEENKYSAKYFSFILRFTSSFAEYDSVPAIYYAHTCPGGELNYDNDNIGYNVDYGFVVDSYKGLIQNDGNIHFGGNQHVFFSYEGSFGTVQIEKAFMYTVTGILSAAIAAIIITVIIKRNQKKKEKI